LLIPVVPGALSRIALLVVVPLPTRSEPTALPSGPVLPPWADAATAPPIIRAATKPVVLTSFCMMFPLSILTEFPINEAAHEPFLIQPSCGSRGLT
jgi:hypothetical protein